MDCVLSSIPTITAQPMFTSSDKAVAVFNMNCGTGRPELRENYGFPKRMVSHIRSVLTESSEELCGKWEEIHGIA